MESAASSDTSNSDSWPYSSSNRENSRIPFSPLRFFNSPVSSLLEYSGILRVRPDFHSDAQPLMSEATNNPVTINENSLNSTSNSNDNNGEVAIRIIGAGEQDRIGIVDNRGESEQAGLGLGLEEPTGDFVDDNYGGSGSSNDTNRETSSSQRYDIQQAARWIEQILPFALLLLMVFIRQHLQGNFWSIEGLLYCNILTLFMFIIVDVLNMHLTNSGELYVHHISFKDDANHVSNLIVCHIDKLYRIHILMILS